MKTQWTIEVEGSKINIMERALILDDGPEIPPDRTTSIPASGVTAVEEKGSWLKQSDTRKEAPGPKEKSNQHQ